MSSENELCEAYNVSRVTVRKAIDLLVQEGYVYTIKGKGTYVKGKYIEQPLTHFTAFGRIFAAGASAHTAPCATSISFPPTPGWPRI